MSKLEANKLYTLAHLQGLQEKNRIGGFHVRRWLTTSHEPGGVIRGMIEADEEGAYEGWLPEEERMKLSSDALGEYVEVMFASLGIDPVTLQRGAAPEAKKDAAPKPPKKKKAAPKKASKEQAKEAAPPREVKQPPKPSVTEAPLSSGAEVMGALSDLDAKIERLLGATEGIAQTAMSGLHETREARIDTRAGFENQAQRLERAMGGVKEIAAALDPDLAQLGEEVWQKPLDEFPVEMEWGDNLPPLD